MLGNVVRFAARIYLLRAAYKFITRLTSRPRQQDTR
jgi:hypothetical protein